MSDNKRSAGAAGAGAVYGLGWIGALVYYIGTANGFWDGVWGVLQSIVWPAFFVYGVMDKLNVPRRAAPTARRPRRRSPSR